MQGLLYRIGLMGITQLAILYKLVVSGVSNHSGVALPIESVEEFKHSSQLSVLHRGFSDEKPLNTGPTGTVNTGNARVDCISHSGMIQGTGVKYHHTFFSAWCNVLDVHRRKYFVKCNTDWSEPPYSSVTRGVWKPTWEHTCPEGKICMPWMVYSTGGSVWDIECVDPAQVQVEHVSRSTTPDDGEHCGKPLELPAQHSHGTPNKDISVVLTESIAWTNGSAYEASALYIQDSTLGKGYDRTYRVDAHLASTEVILRSVRGRIQPRTFKFCTKLSDISANALVVFTYAYFVLTNPLRGSPVTSVEDNTDTRL